MEAFVFENIIKLPVKNVKPGIKKDHEIDWKGKYKSTRLFLEEMDIRVSAVKKATYQIIKNIESRLVIPGKDEQVRIRTQRQISLIAIVLKIMAKHRTVEEILITSYTLNLEAFNVLLDLLKAGRIKRLYLFLTSSYSFRDPGHYKHLKAKCLQLNSAGYDIHLAFAWIHLKITLIKAGDEHYQIEGSANYSQNNMVEQIFFENNKKTYDHDRHFLTSTMMNKKQKATEFIC